MRIWLAMGLLALGLAVGWGVWALGADAPAAGAGGPPEITFVDEDEEGQGGGAGTAATHPFGAAKADVSRKDAVPGYGLLSNGLKMPGKIYTTRSKRLKIFNVKRNLYEYVPVPAVKRMEVAIDWERLDKEWRFKEAGSPGKVYTGRIYPLRQLAWRLVLRNDHEIVGHILGQPLYVEHNGKAERFLFSKRQKGATGTTLQDLLYLKSVVFGAEAYNEAVEELKRKAEAAGKAEAPAGKSAP